MSFLSLSKEYNTLNIIVSTGRSIELLGRNVTVKELDDMNSDELEAYYKIYELNYSEKVSSSLNSAILDLYSYAINRVVPIDDVEKLRDDLRKSYILNNELKNITGGLARIGGKLWSLVEITLTTVKHIRPKTEAGEVLCKEKCEVLCKDNQSTLPMNNERTM
jgi:hypothetical protein